MNKESIFDLIRQGRISILLGGDSKLYDGMITNAEIIDHLAKKCKYPDGNPLSLPEVSEYYAEVHGYSKLVETIKNLVCVTPGDSQLIKTIVRIPSIFNIFCTTLDECINSYFPIQELAVIRSDIDVALALSRPRRLYRLNGTVNNPEGMVLTKGNLMRKIGSSPKSAVYAHLEYDLTVKNFLIIGNDLRDWDFTYYLEEVTHQLGDFRQKAILFSQNPDSVLVSKWNKKNVETIDELPLDFLKGYLDWEAKIHE